MSRLQARPALLSDCAVIAADIRAQDAEELAQDPIESDVDPLTMLERSFHMTPWPITLTAKEVPVVMGGIVPCWDAIGTGCVWLVGTNAVECHKASFMRETSHVISMLLTRFAKSGRPLFRLYNLTPRSYPRALAWMEWLGFSPRGSVAGKPPACQPFEIMVLETPDGRWQEDLVRPRRPLHGPAQGQAASHPAAPDPA